MNISWDFDVFIQQVSKSSSSALICHITEKKSKYAVTNLIHTQEKMKIVDNKFVINDTFYWF